MTTSQVVLAGCLALMGTILTGIFGLLLAKMLRPNELIDQLQEERGDTGKRLAKAEVRIETLAFRQRYFEDYVNELREHIAQGKGPPPPTYPPGLLRIDLTGDT